MQLFQAYHAHVYFNADSFDAAEQLCKRASKDCPAQKSMHLQARRVIRPIGARFENDNRWP